MSDDAQLALLTEADARELTNIIARGLAAVWDDVVIAYRRRADRALGYPSWDAYCREEFGTLRLRLPAEERSIAVQSLRAEGLSVRAIAAATGASVGTVHADGRAGVQDRTPARPVTGQDGKTYGSTRPARPAPVAPPQRVPPPESWPDRPHEQPADELAARREHADAALAEVDRQRAETDDFNAATAHLVPRRDAERPYGLAAIQVSRAIEALPMTMDPDELARCVPDTSAYRLDDLPAALDWISRLIAARREHAS